MAVQKEKNEKAGYIVKLHAGGAGYRLFKTRNGAWYLDADETQPITDATALAIKKPLSKKKTRAYDKLWLL